MQNKKRLTAMIDCARNSVLTVKSFKKLIDYLSAMGYTALEIYAEDVFEVDGEPLWGYLRGRYTKQDFKELADYSESKGMTLIPCVELLAHLEHIFRWDKYKKIRDNRSILLIDEEETYTLIENVIKTVRECFKSNTLDIGYDEASSVGLGKYLKLHGYHDPYELLSKHLNRISKIAQKYGFDILVDSDLFFSLKTGDYYCYNTPDVITKEIADSLPDNCTMTYWDYFVNTSNCKKHINAHRNFNRPFRFMASVNNWNAFSPRNSAYFWLPQSMKACREEGITDVSVAFFGDDGGESSVFAYLPQFFFAAEQYRGNTDTSDIKERFFKLFGLSFDEFYKLTYPHNVDGTDKNFSSEKLYLFNDVFSGIYDDLIPRVTDHIKSAFPVYAKELNESAKKDINKDFSYLFEFGAAMCEAITVKHDLGIRTRKAYKEKDKEALKSLLNDYDKAINLIDNVYMKFRTLWRKERKGNGFEVQDIRFGGLKQRLFDCRTVLADYINGEIEFIDELEQDILAIHGDEDMKTQQYGKIVSVNTLTHFTFN